jgi:hypothetical protein
MEGARINGINSTCNWKERGESGVCYGDREDSSKETSTHGYLVSHQQRMQGRGDDDDNMHVMNYNMATVRLIMGGTAIVLGKGGHTQTSSPCILTSSSGSNRRSKHGWPGFR